MVEWVAAVEHEVQSVQVEVPEWERAEVVLAVVEVQLVGVPLAVGAPLGTGLVASASFLTAEVASLAKSASEGLPDHAGGPGVESLMLPPVGAENNGC